MNIARIQTSFARKAVHQPEHRFCDLYSLICARAWVEEALDRVLSNQGSRTESRFGSLRTKTSVPLLSQRLSVCFERGGTDPSLAVVSISQKRAASADRWGYRLFGTG